MQSFWLSEVDSTNDELKRRLQAAGPEGLAPGTWVGADFQSKGRGRGFRTWTSAPGNLFFSQYLEIEQPRFLPWLPLLVGGVLRSLLSERTHRELGIKWPNDLWILPEQKKCAGILCEGFSIGARHGVIVGVGANLASLPQGVDAGTVTGWDAPSLAHTLAERIREKWRQELATQFSWTRAQLNQWGLFKLGSELEVTDSPGSKPRKARFLGYGASGELVVETQDISGPKVQTLWSEEVSIRPHSLSSR